MYTYPFSALVGQDKMTLALILNAIQPAIGGVLDSGRKRDGQVYCRAPWRRCCQN